jgi:hypothetical protein
MIDETLAPIAVEGSADFFFGRPLDANPIRAPATLGGSWRTGWLDASFLEQVRGDKERRRWLQAA